MGLGNPYRTDDGAGVVVLRTLSGDGLSVMGDRDKSANPSLITHHSSPITHHEVVFMESAHSGLPLAQALVGYARALIVDAAPFLPPGEIELAPITDHPSRITDHVPWVHGLGLAEALVALARAGFSVPECWALAIGVPPDPRFGEGLSPEVAAVVPRAVEEVRRWLTQK